MAVNFTPDLKPYSGQGKFRYWVQMVLPTIYDDSLSYMELLNKVVYVINLALEDIDAAENNIGLMLNSFEELQNYVNQRLDGMTFEEYINKWLDEHPEATTTVQDGAITLQKLNNKLIDYLNNDYSYEITNKKNRYQDAAIYENILFTFDGNGNCRIINWETGETIKEVIIPGNIISHFNAVSWGNFYNEGDRFPLLYSSNYNGTYSDTTPLPVGTCTVYRIDNEFNFTPIQNIDIGFIPSELWAGTSQNVPGRIRFGNFLVDNDKLYVYTNVVYNMVGKTRIFKFTLPPINNDITLTQLDISEYFEVPMIPYPQGAKIKDGILYACGGSDTSAAEKSSRLTLIDLNNKREISSLYLGSLMNEPEAIIFINDDMYIAGLSDYFYKINNVTNYNSLIGDLNNLKTPQSRTIVEAINSAIEPIYTQCELVDGFNYYKNDVLKTGQVKSIGLNIGLKQGTAPLPINTYHTIAILPEDFRPIREVIKIVGYSSGTFRPCVLKIMTDGKIQVLTYFEEISQNINLNETFI